MEKIGAAAVAPWAWWRLRCEEKDGDNLVRCYGGADCRDDGGAASNEIQGGGGDGSHGGIAVGMCGRNSGCGMFSKDGGDN